jgi:2-oxoglutarate ferredoxin oxidoreductase subunit alpha
MESQHKHAYRLIYKVRNHKDVIRRYEALFMDDDPEVVLVAYGAPSRVMLSAAKQARKRGLKVGCIRLISLWPFCDELFNLKTNYLSIELNYDGQLVREVQRCAPTGSRVGFFGKCGELPSVAELIDCAERMMAGKPLKTNQWEWEVW